MIYLLATLLAVGYATDIPPCVMQQCGEQLGSCMATLMGPNAETEGFQCLINQGDEDCNDCLMQLTVDEGAPSCYKDDCPPETLACFASGSQEDAVIMQCFTNSGADNKCLQCIASADQGGNDDSHSGHDSHDGHDHDHSDDSIDMECMMTDCDVQTCGAMMGQDMEQGAACMLSADDATCNACFMSIAESFGTPECYTQDCDVATTVCFFSSQGESDTIDCIKAMDTNDACNTCVTNFEKEQKKKDKKKSSAAALSLVAAVGATLLALF